jgi:DUF4097 and DUF4098 domain-containing protein YvlB
VHLEVFSGDITVGVGQPGRVLVTVDGAGARQARLVAETPDRVRVEFDGRRRLRTGDVHVEVPPKSGADLSTVSGGVVVRGLGGQVRVRTVEGDIDVERAAGLEAQAVSGDIRAHDIGGPTRIRSVAGTVSVASSTPAPQIELDTTSGDLEWRGTCGKGCRLDARTMSGDVVLHPTKESSFALRYQSHSGDLEDGVSMIVTREKRAFGTSASARFGKGEGVIECQSFSGDLRVKR